MANVYFSAEFAGVSLLISEIETVEGRDVAVQSPARGSRHWNKDRGQKHRVVTAQLLFIDRPGQAPYLERFDVVRTLANADEAQVFSHPLLGSYLARFSDFTHRAKADELKVEVSCTILPEEEPQAVFPSGAGVSSEAGLEAVSVASSAADDALAALGESSETPAAVGAAVQGWADADELDAQQVFLEAASLVEDLNTEIESLSLSLDRWPAYRAMCLLRYQLTRAAESFTSASEQLVEITLGADMPLLAICTEVYGAALAVEQAARVQKLNRVRTPGRVTRGTVLKLPAEGAA
jgi:hypothetical protein